MSEEWRNWKHITKLDPDKKITPAVIDAIIATKTDAIMISGTLGITKEKVNNVLKLLKNYDIPKVLEPATPQGLVYGSGYDWMFVPSVFNTDKSLWINGLHKAWIKHDKDKINWDIVVPEALIILNPKCSAAKVTQAKVTSKEDVVAAAMVAERYFKFPVVYIEYSGAYGDPEIVKAVSENLKSAKLIYGGGIRTQEQAAEMSKYATIVVGNTIYDEGLGTFVNTMRGTLIKELKIINQRLKELKEVKERKNKEFKEKKTEMKMEKAKTSEEKGTKNPKIKLPKKFNISFKRKKGMTKLA